MSQEHVYRWWSSDADDTHTRTHTDTHTHTDKYTHMHTRTCTHTLGSSVLSVVQTIHADTASTPEQYTTPLKWLRNS